MNMWRQRNLWSLFYLKRTEHVICFPKSSGKSGSIARGGFRFSEHYTSHLYCSIRALSFYVLKLGNTPDPLTFCCHCDEHHSCPDGYLCGTNSYSPSLELIYQNADVSEIKLQIGLLHLAFCKSENSVVIVFFLCNFSWISGTPSWSSIRKKSVF